MKMGKATKAKKTDSSFEITLGILVSLVVLFFWIPLEDAMNLSKFFLILVVTVPFAFRYLNTNFLKLKETKFVSVILATFIFFAFLSSVTSSSLNLSLLGNHARLNGFLLYASLSVLTLVIISNFRITYFDRYFLTIYILGLTGVTYSFFQYFHKDFVNWNLSFNQIVGTLGNPDFNSAFLGFFGIIAYYYFLVKSGKQKYCFLFTSVLAFWLAISTEAKQGPFVYLIGIMALYLFRKTYKRSYLIAFLTSGSGLGILIIAGMLNVGPLAGYIYKASITFRGDYWRAGWRMFADNPLLGVGFGRYGDFFRQYRDITQVVRRGSELTSDQPHNVFLDFLSTGGLFTFLCYVTLVATILWFGLKNIKLAQDPKARLQGALLLSLYIAYQLQSFISIDQIALATFGWVVGGLIIAKYVYSKNGDIVVSRKVNVINYLSPFFAFALGLAILIPVWNADVAARYVNGLASKLNDQTNANFVSFETEKLANNKSIDPYYTQLAGISYLRFNQIDKAVDMFKQSLSKNSRDSVSAAYLASIYLQTNSCEKSLYYSKLAVELDPFNQTNLLDRMRCQLKVGNKTEALQLQRRILEINPTNEVAHFSKSLI